MPLPKGKSDGFQAKAPDGQDIWLVKWVLLTPAIFPAIKADPANAINAHPGGWLPNWIYLDWDTEKAEARENPKNGAVLLKSGETARCKNEDGRLESRETWRARVRSEKSIPAILVAALVGKPIPVTIRPNPRRILPYPPE